MWIVDGEQRIVRRRSSNSNNHPTPKINSRHFRGLNRQRWWQFLCRVTGCDGNLPWTRQCNQYNLRKKETRPIVILSMSRKTFGQQELENNDRGLESSSTYSATALLIFPLQFRAVVCKGLIKFGEFPAKWNDGQVSNREERTPLCMPNEMYEWAQWNATQEMGDGTAPKPWDEKGKSSKLFNFSWLR